MFFFYNLFLKIKKNFILLILIFFCYNCFAGKFYKIDNIILNIKNNNINSYYYKKLLKNEFGYYISKNNIINIKYFLYKLNHFSKVKIFYLKNDNILFLLKYKFIINKLFFVGNKIFNNSEILYFLNKFNISNGKFLNNYSILKFKIYLINKYKKIGKYNINIKFLKINLIKNKFLLKLIINEGNFLLVKKINIFGNINISKNKIFSLMKIKESNFIFNLLFKNNFYYNQFIKDLDNIKYYYFNNGYFDFFIKEIKIKFYKKNLLNIFIKFNEGNRYKINNIIFKSNILYFNKILNLIKYKKFKNNIYYKYNRIKNIISDINIFFKQKGYANLNINIKYKKYKYNIIFFIYINFNKKFYINKVLFEGNININKNFLKKKIILIKNKLYNIVLIKKIIIDLKKTNSFNFIKYKEKFINIYKSNKINIIYKISKKNNNNLFNINIGYNNKNIINYNIKLFKKNFLFYNNNFLMKILKNKFNKSINTFFVYPINKYNNVYIKHEFLFNNFIYNNINSNYLSSNYISKNSIIFLFNKNFKYSLSLNYDNNYIYKIKSQLLYIEYLNSINKKYNLNSLNNNFYINNLFLVNNFSLNKLDNNFFPNFGYYINLYIKYTLLNLYNNYLKINFSFCNYIPLNKYKKWILFINNNIGYIKNLNNKKIPFYEYFNFGKNNNFIRGFNYENINDNKIFINSKSYKCKNNKNICFYNSVLEGNFILSNNLNIIIPNSYFLNNYFSKYIRISFFLDNGIILNNNFNNIFKNKNINNNTTNISYYKNILKSSIGIYFNIITPIGALNLSFNLPIKYNNNNEINYFQFNIGNNI